MTRLLLSLLIASAAVVALGAEPRHGEFAARKLTAAGVEREYRLVVPKSVVLAKPAPLMIAFHGMLIDSKDLMPLYTKLNETATKHKFILAYPNAIGRSWGIDGEKIKRDLALFDALVAEISGEYKVDAERIFVLGMSNGGYFAHVVARERSTVIAAAASHSGPLGLETLFGVNAKRKYPVLIIHGDRDPIFSIDFARENRDKYQREGHTVEFVELKGVGHMWGVKADVNEAIWKFFAEHPRAK